MAEICNNYGIDSYIVIGALGLLAIGLMLALIWLLTKHPDSK